MEKNSPSPSAERHQQEQIKDAKINKELGTALIHFKTGDRETGEFFLKSAIEEAAKKNISIPLQVIDSIMDGKSPQENSPAPKTEVETTQEKNPWLENQRQEINGRLLDTLEPLRRAVETKLRSIIEEMRKKLGVDLELSPELV